jgi:hypothetical protein
LTVLPAAEHVERAVEDEFRLEATPSRAQEMCWIWVGALLYLGDLSPGSPGLAIYGADSQYQRKYISVVLVGSHCCLTLDGLETA